MAGGRVGSHEVGMTDFAGATSLDNADLAMWNHTIGNWADSVTEVSSDKASD